MAETTRVVFVFKSAPDTTDYYSHVLARLDNVAGVSVTVVAGGDGAARGQQVAAGSYATVTCREEQWPDGEYCLPDLPDALRQAHPDVVVTVPEYLVSFHRDARLRDVRRRPGFKLLLKTIPFRVPVLNEFRSVRIRRLREVVGVPSRWQQPLNRLGAAGKVLARAIGFVRLGVGTVRVWRDCRAQCTRWRLPDGHVNYTEDAFAVYGSYGVPADRIHVIGNSPDTDRHFRLRSQVEQAGVQRHPHRLLHVGRMVAWKRVDLLLEAARRLKDRYPDLDVVVAGEGPMAAEWRQLSESLGQQGYVRFVGGVYEPLEVARLFMESGVYVLAGMGGISINDAMCYGCPVVCSVCDGTEKRLVRDGETGCVFRDGDVDDLTAKIDGLLRSPDKQRRVALGGAKVVLDEVNIYSVLRGYVMAFQSVSGIPMSAALRQIDADAKSARGKHAGVLT